MKIIIFLFILFQIVAVLKKVFEASMQKEQTEGKKTARKSPWQEKLMDVAAKIKEEIEAQNAKTSGQTADSWDHITKEKKRERPKSYVAKKDGTGATAQSKSRMLSDRPKTQSEKVTKRPQMPPLSKKTAPEPDKVQEEAKMLQEKPVDIVKTKEKHSVRIRNLKGLKKAVLWKEILDKPVGLREDTGQIKPERVLYK